MRYGFDLDGTIASLDVHGKFDREYWESREVLIDPWSVVKGSDEVLIITARPAEWRTVTEEWLRKNHIAYDRLILLDLPVPDPADKQWQFWHAIAKADAIRKHGIEVYYEDTETIADILTMFLGNEARIIKVGR